MMKGKYFLGFLCLIMAFVLNAHAQVGVSVKLAKSDFVAGEPILALVTVSNRTGGEIQLNDNKGMPWVSLHVVRFDGEEMSNVSILKMPPLKLPNGKSSSAQVDLTKLYDLKNEGMYRVYASVHYQDVDYSSKRDFINIRRGTPVWSQNVGIPKGMPGAGSVCKFSVLTLTHQKGADIYVKLTDNSTGRNIRTERLGAWTQYTKPDVRIDAQNKVHVLYLNTPSIYVYSTIEPSGKISKPLFYKRGDGPAAKLAQDASGAVFVQYGIPYDPNAPKDPVRNADDRPW